MSSTFQALIHKSVAPLFCAILMVSCAGSRVPKPNGGYPIGTSSHTFVDSSRDERYSPDLPQPRRILARVWYPAASVEGRKAEPFFSPALADALSRHMGIPKFLLAGGPSNSYAEAPVSLAQSRWPIIVFAQGFGSFDKQNQSQMEEFASEGYVVVSLGFPYESVLCEFSDGSSVEQSDGGDVGTIAALSKDQKALATRIAGLFAAVRSALDQSARIQALAALRSDPYFQAMRPAMEYRFADAVYVLGHLGELDASGPLAGRLDLRRVAFYGHSFGGSLALEIGLRRPDLVIAVADLDGVFLDSSGSGLTKIDVPLFLAYSTEQKSAGLEVQSDRLNDLYFYDSRGGAWSVSYKGTGHHNFSDLGYVPFLKNFGLIGSADGYQTGLLVQKQLTAFFDHYLRDGPLPDFQSPATMVESR